MEEPLKLTVLYTYGLRGDLDVLPRLYTLIRQLRALNSQEAVKVCHDDPAPPIGRILLLDLGDSCAPDVWHCAVSGGLSMPLAFDGMGYHAANVSISSDARARVSELTQLKLIDAEHPAEVDGVWLTLSAPHPDRLTILLRPAEFADLTDNLLTLPAVKARQVGEARLRGHMLVAHMVYDLPTNALPDPTIAGVVDLVTSEARYRQKRG